MAAKLIKVDYMNQSDKYPTGCESISTIMCLHYWKIDITPEEFIDKYLEKGNIDEKNGQLFAPNPFDKFVGSPYSKFSFGCYEPVIEKALNKLMSDKQLSFEVKNLNNAPMDTIIKEYIDKNIPVIFWATMDLKESFFTRIWTVPETGEKYQWKAREHCMLLVGYDNEKDGYYFNDPLNNNGIILYNKALVEKRHEEQFSNAIAIVKKN
jgi:uncharacterized protein YvpB